MVPILTRTQCVKRGQILMNQFGPSDASEQHPSTILYIAPVGDRRNSPRLRYDQIRQRNVYCRYIAPSFKIQFFGKVCWPLRYISFRKSTCLVRVYNMSYITLWISSLLETFIARLWLNYFLTPCWILVQMVIPLAMQKTNSCGGKDHPNHPSYSNPIALQGGTGV